MGNVHSLKVAVLAFSQPHLWHGICCSSSQFCFLSSYTDCCGWTPLQSSPRLPLLSFSWLERISYTGQITLLKPRSGVTSLLKMTAVSLPCWPRRKRPKFSNLSQSGSTSPFWNHLSNTSFWASWCCFCKPSATSKYSTFAYTAYNALLLLDNALFIFIEQLKCHPL